jgi:WD40 repeat protein
VAWSPDGKRLVSTGKDGTVRVWDATNGQHLDVYLGHSGWLEALAWSPDGTRIASGGEDGVQVWSAG